jgi:carbamoyl-phosphate synthase large subunit
VKKYDARQLAKLCRDIALDKKALDPVLLDVRKVSSVTDYFLILSGNSEPHLKAIADEIGYPVVIRPSYVLGGRAMEIVRDGAQLDRYVARLAGDLDRPGELVVSRKSPLLIDRYLSDATEVDVDCLCDGKDTFIAGIMEHIEEAGIHSGDSACALPPHSLTEKTIAELERQTRALALALNVGGLMNVQYAIKDGDIYVLEVNPRASRTVPFVAKVIGLPIAKIAARIMAGEKLKSFGLKASRPKHRAVKEAVFPFARFPGVDTVLGPEMKSTGEVMGIGASFGAAFAKAQIAAGNLLPQTGAVFISVRDEDKAAVLPTAARLARAGFALVATQGTAAYLRQHGLTVEAVTARHRVGLYDETVPGGQSKLRLGDVALPGGLARLRPRVMLRSARTGFAAAPWCPPLSIG